MEINYHTMMIGNAIELLINKRGKSNKEVAQLICKKYPFMENGKLRKISTMQNNITNIVKGRSLPFDTITKLLEVLDAKKLDVE